MVVAHYYLLKIKCCKSTCEETNIYRLLACADCLDKCFDRHYSMINATWYLHSQNTPYLFFLFCMCMIQRAKHNYFSKSHSFIHKFIFIFILIFDRSRKGLQAVPNALACEEHFQWHRTNCQNSHMGFSSYLAEKDKMHNDRYSGQLNEHFF